MRRGANPVRRVEYQTVRVVGVDPFELSFVYFNGEVSSSDPVKSYLNVGVLQCLMVPATRPVINGSIQPSIADVAYQNAVRALPPGIGCGDDESLVELWLKKYQARFKQHDNGEIDARYYADDFQNAQA